MPRKLFEKELVTLRDGGSFAKFTKATDKVWVAQARMLMRKWGVGLPKETTIDDLKQELLIAAWRFVAKWDPKYGVSISRYVVWNAVDKAKKALHKLRGASRAGGVSLDRAKSVIPVMPSQVSEGITREDEQYSIFERALVDAAYIEDERLDNFVVASEIEVYLEEDEGYELKVLAATRDFDLAVDALGQDKKWCLRNRLGSDTAVQTKIRNTLVEAQNIQMLMAVGILAS